MSNKRKNLSFRNERISKQFILAYESEKIN